MGYETRSAIIGVSRGGRSGFDVTVYDEEGEFLSRGDGLNLNRVRPYLENREVPLGSVTIDTCLGRMKGKDRKKLEQKLSQ